VQGTEVSVAKFPAVVVLGVTGFVVDPLPAACEPLGVVSWTHTALTQVQRLSKPSRHKATLAKQSSSSVQDVPPLSSVGVEGFVPWVPEAVAEPWDCVELTSGSTFGTHTELTQPQILSPERTQRSTLSIQSLSSEHGVVDPSVGEEPEPVVVVGDCPPVEPVLEAPVPEALVVSPP
jgi:hypothetical protein